MTVDTPFPERPPTPFWDPRGGPSGLGDVTPLSTGINTALADATAAYIATQQAGLCPPNYQFNPSTGACMPTATISVGGNSSGILILVALAALFFYMKGR